MVWENLTEEEKGYFAGFLDGEGSIVISEYGNGYYRASMTIYNTDKETIEYLCRKLDYSIDEGVDVRNDNRHNRNCYMFSIRRQDELLRFLKKLKPYLVTKKEQAEVAIEFLDEVVNRDSHEYTEEKLEKLGELRQEMVELNE